MKKDSIVAISEGAYSDFAIAGTYTALRDFDPTLVMNHWLELNPIQAAKYKADFAAFMGWLLTEGYLAKTTVDFWHIGAYSSFGGYPSVHSTTGEETTESEELAVKAEGV